MATTTVTPVKASYTIDDIRKRAKIDIILPREKNSSTPELDDYEFVTVNGITTQIKRGELVTVNMIIFEALINSGRYDAKQILA